MALRLSPSEQMNEGNRNLLISNMGFLQENLELSTLLPYMTPVLNDEDFAAIRSFPTTREQVEMLVTILPERGDRAFHCFIQNLRISQPHLADSMFKKPHIGETMLPRGQFSTFHKGEQSRQHIEWAREQSEQPNQRKGKQSKQQSEREREQSEQPKERKGEQFEQPSEREREQSEQPSERERGQSKQLTEQRGQSRQPSEREREQSKQPSEREREQSKQPSEREREQSRQPSKRERGQSKQPDEPRGQSRQPSERKQGQSKQLCERERGQSKQPSEREGGESEQSEQPSEQEGEQFIKQSTERHGEQSEQPRRQKGDQPEQPSEREREQSEQPTERQSEQSEQLSERERELPNQPTERQGEQSEQRSEWEGENSKHPSKHKRLDEACRLLAEAKEREPDTQLRIEKLKKTLEECKQVLGKGVSALHPQGKASKRMILAGLVTEEGCSWILEKSGICIKFSPNAVQSPIMVTSSVCLPCTVLPPLEDDETLVSNIIELACDDPVAIQFSKVTVTLSHSASELRGYELVLKERIDSEENIWKDLETCCPLDPLGEISTSQSGLRFAQAKITSFSMYAVISRLKSYKFLVTKESPEFTCTVTEYPDVSVTVPTRYLPAVEDFTFTLKVQQTPNDDYEEKGAFISPVLHISCPVEVKLEEPASIRIPITLEEKQTDLQNLSSSQIKVFHRCTRRKSQEWKEITRKLKTPPKLENGVVSFQVKRFSQYAGMVVEPGQLAGDRDDLTPHIPHPAGSQHAGFLACLCQSLNKTLLILCCFPYHRRSEVKKDVAEEYNVIFRGESTSRRPLYIKDEAFFHLPDKYTLLNKESTFLTFLGHDTCQKNFPVLVESTDGIQSINFFKFKKGREEKETLCTVTMATKSSLQGTPDFPASKPLPLEGQPLNIDKNSKLWKIEVTLKQLLPLREDLGSCWMDLGIELNLSYALLQSIRQESNSNRERAYAVLWNWKDNAGSSATMGHLVVALVAIRKIDIAHKLIGQLDKKEKEDNGAHHAQLQVNVDQPRGESSSSIMKQLDEKEKDDNKAHHAQLQVNEDQPRGESSSSIMKQLDEKEKEDNKAHHAQLQVNEDQLRGESSSSIMRAQECQEDDENVITKRSELKDEQDQEKEEKQAQGSETPQNEITKLRDEVKQNNEVIKTLQEELKNAKEVTKKLQERFEELQELEILQDEVKQQEEDIRRLSSELKNETDRQQKLKQDLKSRKYEKKSVKVSKTTSEAAISGLSSGLRSEREFAQEPEQVLNQLLEELQMLDQELRRLQDEIKQKEETVVKLTSDLA